MHHHQAASPRPSRSSGSTSLNGRQTRHLIGRSAIAFGIGAGIDIAAGTKDYTIRDTFTLPETCASIRPVRTRITWRDR